MLEPGRRTLLFEALRPPEGYRLDAAVGTTYSLDLVALLTAPLAFTIFDWEDREGRPTADPLVLLETLRAHAERITVFCQTGRIAVPARHQPLFGYLEEMVVEAAALHPEGAFHPKVWVLRFAGDEQPTVYRLLCMSRNLTFDRSWDTVLALEGELTDRRNAYADNHPLGDFVAALPSMAARPVSETVRERLATLEHEVRRVKFEPPPGFDDVRFVPMGLARRASWPFPDTRRPLMVVSPFLSSGVLERVTSRREDCVLISREEALADVPSPTLRPFGRLFCLAAEAEPEDAAEEGTEVEDLESLHGLHAKLFVMDDGWNARVWTGSANATEAAFSRNLEFVVELRGKKSTCGIEAVLGGSGPTSLGALLQPFTVPEEDGKPPPPDGRLEQLVDAARRWLSSAGMQLLASPGSEEGTFDLELFFPAGAAPEPAKECSIACWPVSLGTERAVAVDPGADPPPRFASLSWQALTTFVAFAVSAEAEGERFESRFVLNLPLDGAPADRRERLLEQVLCDRKAVLRFLLLLLSDDRYDVAALQAVVMDGHQGAAAPDTPLQVEVPLFEALLRALDRDRVRLDRVARLVEDLSASEAGRALLPEGFGEVWRSIWDARKELGDG